MTMPRFHLNVLGEELVFRSTADEARIEQAKSFVEEQYEQLHCRGGQLSRNALLALLILGIADDLLQSQERLDTINDRVSRLLDNIDAHA